MSSEVMREVDDIKKPEGVVRQLNFDDVFGTNYGFEELEQVDSPVAEDNTPSDYENFVAMLNKSQFTHGFEERKGTVQMNELGDTFDINTKEIVLVQANGLRTVAMFCESDESLLGFIMEDMTQKMKPASH